MAASGAGGVSLLAESEVVSWLRVGLGVSHYWQRGKWYHGCEWGWGCLTIGREGSGIMAASGAGGVSLLAERESGIMAASGAGGVSLLAEREVVSWLRVGLGVSHYWQRGKWYHGCEWGWGCLTIGREGSEILAQLTSRLTCPVSYFMMVLYPLSNTIKQDCMLNLCLWLLVLLHTC